MNILETERLILRVFRSEDIEDFAPIESDPEVMRFYASGPRPREQSERNIGKFIQTQKENGFSFWAVIHKADQRFIGYCGLLPQMIDGTVEPEIGYKLAVSHWGQGLATEAAGAVRLWGFAHLDVPRLVSIIDPGNAASIRVAEKNGLSYDRSITYAGKPCSVYAVGRPDQKDDRGREYRWQPH